MGWWPWSSRPDAESAPAAAASSLPLIRLQAVDKTFDGDDADGGTRALVGITTDIGRGEYVAISGPSGCGKSTLLSVLALLESPTSGQYWLNGRATASLTPADRARVRNLDVGLIFQSFNLIGDMTVAENVEYPLTLRQVSAEVRRATVAAALERVGLTDRARQRPGQLSGGHQQLVAIARAFAGRPAILLADEPTGNLDSKSGDAVMEMLAELHAGGATVCLATHNPLHMARAQRQLTLFDGRLAE